MENKESEDDDQQQLRSKTRSGRPAAIGVAFRPSGKIYYFRPGRRRLEPGDHIIVETERGTDLGKVVSIEWDEPDFGGEEPMKPVIRKATSEDLAREKALREEEEQALQICEEKIADHGLPMKLIDADYTLDKNCLVFFFSADGRVDFRDLVRDLASIFKTRIELRQIGVRDEAKMVGGLGPCGRPLCCQTFLRDFEPVGIRIAKDQGLSLNPTKISGVCDRLMCCLRFEHEQYVKCRRGLPDVGKKVNTPHGSGEVVDVNVLRQEVVVQLGPDKKVIVGRDEIHPAQSNRNNEGNEDSGS
ncbi:MAG: stage 0 sporulation family protein [Armatimonadota bacterium]